MTVRRSHLESLRLIESGGADGAAIDSNVLLGVQRKRAATAWPWRVVETWGPFPIQPVVIRSAAVPSVKAAVRQDAGPDLCAVQPTIFCNPQRNRE